MKSLRTQLLASHLALVALMALVMVGAVVNFLRLGNSIDHILRDNYQSVIAAQTMKETLERQDSAATFFLAGQRDKARTQFAANATLFEKALSTERANVTERGEQLVADALQSDYTRYKGQAESLLRGEQKDGPAFYFSNLEPAFLQMKGEAQKVLEINQAAIVRADERAKRDARQGATIGIVMTLAALGLAIWFARRAINLALTPLMALVQEAEQVGAGHLNRQIELRRDDEVGLLARAFNDMTAKLREAKKQQDTRLHRAEKMSDAALENLFDPVLVTDATRTLVHLNKAAQGLFGPAQKLSGLPLVQAVAEPKIISAIDRAISSSAISAEEGAAGLVSIQSGDAERIYRLRATPMRDEDTLLGAALVLEDVTHLQTLDRLKTEFIGVASHELRTPVTSLLLSAQLLEEGAVGPLSDDQKEVVRAQREDLTRLDDLLRDLLDITKLEAGAMPPRFEWVAPRELIEAAVKGVSAPARSKGVRIHTFSRDDLPLVRADWMQIGRVLSNLLNNAIRHTPDGGTVKVEANKTGENVVFRVTDTGDGIPPDFLERIFERFAQVPGATRGGAGLGLPISQTIVGAHGGRIQVHSEVGRGSAFEFGLEAQN
ncbi:alginate biosynthesis sensor protein KinB [Abditibacteriota bacterium]|nr:alginate biosynthesis sensor protein KinB [Abditibacteriota bacterium]